MIGLNRYANQDNILAGRSCLMYLVIQAAVFMKVIKVLKVMQSILGMSKVIRIGNSRRKPQIASIHVLLHL